MTSGYYLEMMLKLRHNTIGPSVQNHALRRVRRLELFIQNNPKWFDQAPGGRGSFRPSKKESQPGQGGTPKGLGLL